MKKTSLLLCLTFLLSGCSSITQDDADEKNYSQSLYTEEETVFTVERASVSPVVSSTSNIISSPQYVVAAPAAGRFTSYVKVGAEVYKGSKLGIVGGQTIFAPSDAVVTAVYHGSSQVPVNYPVLALRYGGFALTGPAESFLASTNYTTFVTGRFQIEDGVGPAECASIVLIEGDAVPDIGTEHDVTSKNTADTNENTENTQEISEDTVPSLPGQISGDIGCLISKDETVFPGQRGTVVFSGSPHNDVHVVPLSSVAGRVGKGHVTRIGENGKREVVEVQLGVSDGSRIEVLSGLEEGDQISSLPPNLDPRRRN